MKPQISGWCVKSLNTHLILGELKIFTRWRKDGCKKVTVQWCSLHNVFSIRYYILPSCACCVPIIETGKAFSLKDAKYKATNWLII